MSKVSGFLRRSQPGSEPLTPEQVTAELADEFPGEEYLVCRLNWWEVVKIEYEEGNDLISLLKTLEARRDRWEAKIPYSDHGKYYRRLSLMFGWVAANFVVLTEG